MLTLAVFLLAQAPTPTAPIEPLAQEAGAPALAQPDATPAPAVPVPDAVTHNEATPSEPGKFGGLIGAAAGCGAGTGAPGAVVGAGGGFLYWLYGQAAVGACVGWTPALIALGTSGGVCMGAMCLPPMAAGGTVAGAMYGAQADGRDPMAALIGGAPGLVLAGLATATMMTGFVVGTFAGLGGIVVTAVIVGIGALVGIISIPCTMIGSGVTDAVVAHLPPEAKPDEHGALAGTGAPTDSARPQRF